MKARKLTNSEVGLLVTIVIGLLGIVGLSRGIDAHQPPAETQVDEEKLYVTAAVVDRVALGFNGLVADWYWMRSLQYVGRKVIRMSDDVQIDSMGQLNLQLLAPLLDATTSLDPEFMEPYQYAAVVLPTFDVNEAIRITKKGIAANPSAWRLYQHLGYIYWQQKDFHAAGEAYAIGAEIPGAPDWMEAMKARMASEGGSRDTARQIYRRMHEEAGDPQVKEMARRRLLQVDSMDERDALRRVMETYRIKVGRCPSTWQDLQNVLRALRVRVDAAGAPLDPAGTEYILVRDKCDVEVGWKSEVPHK